MQIEHSVRVLPLDAELEISIQKMTAEGWMLLPGVVPVAIYHVVRMQGVLPAGDDGHVVKPTARVTIDETKVKILRDGKLIDAN